jgi:probable rRNA maturation factor
LKGRLFIENRQRTLRIDARYLRRLTDKLIRELLQIENFDLGIYLVNAARMAEMNKTFLQHEGPTDVITFDYQDKDGPALHGEIFICTDEAVAQARQFRTTWQSELTRYLIHGVLHLRGFDDLRPVARRKMKREEERLLRQLSDNVSLSKLAALQARAARKSEIQNRKSPGRFPLRKSARNPKLSA